MLVSLIISAEITDCYGFNVLAAQLKRLPNVEVQLFYLYHKFNEHYPEKTVADLVHLCKASDLVGISLLSSGYRNAIQITQALKSKTDCPVVWGGKHPTIAPEDCLEYADMVGLSEGEDTFFELVEKLESGKPVEEIEGLWVRRGEAIVKNPLRPIEVNLDKYLFPDYSLENKYILDKENLRIRAAQDSDLDNMRAWYPTMITRGCPNVCTFCTNSVDRRLRGMRSRSIGNVIDEVQGFLSVHPSTKRIFFRDDCLSAMPLDFIEEFSDRWKREVGLPCSCSGVIATSEDFEKKIAVLTNGGFTNFKMGIQSGCERVRRKVFARIGETNEVVNKAVSALHSLCTGRINYYMITDNPYETEEELAESIRFTSRLPRPFSLSLFSLNYYPGTAIYNKAIKDNIITDKESTLLESTMDFENTYLNKVFILLKYFELPPLLVKFMTRKETYSRKNYKKLFSAFFRFLTQQDVPNRWIKLPSMRKDKFTLRNVTRWLVWRTSRRVFQFYHRVVVRGK
jgi:radical SAM superfamily enzyme YgiQ (UPF0313 family)